MFFFDPLYFIIMIPPLIFMFYAQSKVNSTFKKYSAVANTQRLTGAAAAERLLRANGLNNIKVEGFKPGSAIIMTPAKSAQAFAGSCK